MVTVAMGEKGIELYSTLEWSRRESLSTIGFAGACSCYLIGFGTVKLITDRKLKNNNRLAAASISMPQLNFVSEVNDLK